MVKLTDIILLPALERTEWLRNLPYLIDSKMGSLALDELLYSEHLYKPTTEVNKWNFFSHAETLLCAPSQLTSSLPSKVTTIAITSCIFLNSFTIWMCILKYYSLALSIKKIHVFEGSFNKFSYHPFLFLTVCLWKNPGYLTYRVSNILICADYIFLFLFNMFFSSLYYLKINNWIQRLDQTQVWSLL